MRRLSPRPRRRVVLTMGQDDYRREEVVDECDARARAAWLIADGWGKVSCYRNARKLWTMTGEPERATA